MSMKDLNQVEQEMYYQKCRHLEESIKREKNPNKRKELQEEYQKQRKNVSMQTLTNHINQKKNKK